MQKIKSLAAVFLALFILAAIPTQLSPLKLMKKLPQCIPISGVLTIMILHIFRLMMKLI